MLNFMSLYHDVSSLEMLVPSLKPSQECPACPEVNFWQFSLLFNFIIHPFSLFICIDPCPVLSFNCYLTSNEGLFSCKSTWLTLFYLNFIPSPLMALSNYVGSAAIAQNFFLNRLISRKTPNFGTESLTYPSYSYLPIDLYLTPTECSFIL